MVSKKSVLAQLKRIDFKQHGWGKAEVGELHNILIPDEKIFECVNGIYEGGFALLVATDVRVLLIDKKPFNYLTIEDLRFDMINEIDYNHRLFGAYVGISTGNRDLKFRSYNQPRLRKLITHVQHCMAESKKQENSHQEDQKQHLEQINERLQTYLMAQHQYLTQQQGGAQVPTVEAPKLDPDLSDYLYAQSLLAEYQTHTGGQDATAVPAADLQQLQAAREAIQPVVKPAVVAAAPFTPAQAPDLLKEGVKEIFGNRQAVHDKALHIAYSKLPAMIRSRKVGRVSINAAHNQTNTKPAVAAQPS